MNVTPAHPDPLPGGEREKSLAAAHPPDLHAEARTEFERILLEAALAAHGGHRQHAAKALGIGRNTVTRKLGSARRRRG